MKVFKSIGTIRDFLTKQRVAGSGIGLVPTMGSLHNGHFELVKTALGEKIVVVVSVFVNPAQFNKKEDLEKYPRDLKGDIRALENLGCHAVFIPEEREIYPNKGILHFNVGYLEEIMEGKFRPGHFSGVALVVCKLLNIVNPDKAYFGQKDLQQLVLIKKLVEELNFNIEVVSVPTVRESNGLAMSSRNQRLNESQKNTAANIYEGLQLLERNVVSGLQISVAIVESEKFFTDIKGFELEYLEVVDSHNLLPITEYNPNIDTSICVAGYIAGVRLLDNICISSKH